MDEVERITRAWQSCSLVPVSVTFTQGARSGWKVARVLFAEAHRKVQGNLAMGHVHSSPLCSNARLPNPFLIQGWMWIATERREPSQTLGSSKQYVPKQPYQMFLQLWGLRLWDPESI